MKKVVGTIVGFFLIATIGYSQNSCSKYYPLEEGTKFQITNYEKNDKPAAVIDYLVKDSTGDSAIIYYEMRDDTGDVVLSSEYGIICENDGISIDFNSLAAPGMMEQYQDMEVDLSGTNLFLPNDLTEGQSLPDADLLMNVQMAPLTMKLTVKIFDRKVEGKETVTTPAGTFDCIILTQSSETKMGVKVTANSREWYAPEVGLVKQESYNKKGKLIGRSVLTKFED